jgi:hypothetical protein
MTINTYRAVFTASNGLEIIENRDYAKPLGFAWRVEYHNAKDETQKAVKFGFSATREAADKATKLPKRCTVTHTQVVEAQNVGTVALKGKKPAKAKAVKPCAVGDIVSFDLGTHLPGIAATVAGKVAKLGRKYAYVEVAGALDHIKVAFANIRPLDSAPAQALAA